MFNCPNSLHYEFLRIQYQQTKKSLNDWWKELWGYDILHLALLYTTSLPGLICEFIIHLNSLKVKEGFRLLRQWLNIIFLSLQWQAYPIFFLSLSSIYLVWPLGRCIAYEKIYNIFRTFFYEICYSYTGDLANFTTLFMDKLCHSEDNCWCMLQWVTHIWSWSYSYSFSFFAFIEFWWENH